MSFEISPMQSFEARMPQSLSSLQQQSLVQLYQPLVGPIAISLYHTLLHLPKETIGLSRRLVHAQLLQNLNVGIKECNQARVKLEAVGLLRTYRIRSSHRQWQQQTLLYDLQLPLDIYQFLQHPLLSTALFNQIGDQNYYQLLKEWEVEILDEMEYAEITSSFQSVFQYVGDLEQDEIEESLKGRRFYRSQAQDDRESLQTDFNYGKFLNYLMAEGIDHSQLTQQLKREVLAVHQIYQIDEIKMTQIVMLATNDLTGKVELEQLKEIANKKQFYKQRKQTRGTISATNQSGDSRLKKEEVQERRAFLKTHYPFLLKEDIEIILLCEQMPLKVFLDRTKVAKGGFATDNEYFYLEDIKGRTTLSEPVLNYLSYYLLIILKREGLYKNDLQRIASEWQQNKIESIPEAIKYIRQQDKAKVGQGKYRSRYYRRNQHKEIVPSWMNEVNDNQSEKSQNDKQSKKTESEPVDEEALKANEEAIRKRLSELFKKEGEE